VGGKYTAASLGGRIEQFLNHVLGHAGLRLTYQIVDGDSAGSDLETPDVLVKFAGPDLEIALANKGELLLALEHLAMEAMRIPQEHHSLLCFDANDYRMLRMEELRLSALPILRCDHSNRRRKFCVRRRIYRPVLDGDARRVFAKKVAAFPVLRRANGSGHEVTPAVRTDVA